jgi:hypothetical protein
VVGSPFFTVNVSSTWVYDENNLRMEARLHMTAQVDSNCNDIYSRHTRRDLPKLVMFACL